MSTTTTKPRLAVDVEVEDHRMLKAYAASVGVSMSDLVRNLLRREGLIRPEQEAEAEAEAA